MRKLLVSLVAAGLAFAVATSPQAAERLGLRSGQKNVLLRIALRHPTRTLTDEEGNRLRDAIYAAVHEGTEWKWAGR